MRPLPNRRPILRRPTHPSPPETRQHLTIQVPCESKATAPAERADTMTNPDPSWTEAELVEARANFAMNTAAPPSIREALGMAATRVDGGFVTVMRNDPLGGVWNRAIGLGLERPLTEEALDQVIAFAQDEGAPCLVVQVAPYAEPTDWPLLLESRGLTPSATWAKLVVASDSVPAPTDDPLVEKLEPDSGDEFAHALAAGFGMAPDGPAHAWLSALASSGDPWHSYGIRDGEELVAVGWMFRDAGSASLLSAATLPEHRRRGFHRALVRRRVSDAARLGCRWVATETGSGTAESPNPAVLSLEHAGLPQTYLRRNWIWRPASA
jgi:GNAT superfamily N-acetyltransferase